ncbi:MAG TPA: type II secretion system protein GspM [Solirubrobacteraceae bacterium]|nr:type II secretion system protein GspM [Solirubrobacteraceae bacterium]
MTPRDRLMLMGIVALAVLLGVWFKAVAPEREHAAKVAAEVESAHRQLASAESQADSASSARAQYSTTYTSLVSLGQAVPASAETPALIYTLDRVSHSRNVQFSSITNGSSGSSGSSATPASATQSAGFTQQPFTFVFNGSFVDLYRLLNQLESFTVRTPSGALRVSGRLLTIDSVSLTPSTGEGQGSSGSSKPKAGQLTGTITATAYVLPAGQSALGGATQSGPTGAQSTTTTTSGSAGTGATTAAVVRVNP